MTTTNPPVGAWPTLLREIMQAHADPDSPEYNECDKARCFWCEQAAAELDELQQDARPEPASSWPRVAKWPHTGFRESQRIFRGLLPKAPFPPGTSIEVRVTTPETARQSVIAGEPPPYLLCRSCRRALVLASEAATGLCSVCSSPERLP